MIGLVVDDEPHIRSYFATILRREGMQIVEAESGSAALTLLETIRPGFVVTDLDMPDIDGLELCRQLRRSPVAADLPIVVVSGSAHTHGHEAIAAGCDAVLSKPCPPALLVATVQRLLVKPSNRPA